MNENAEDNASPLDLLVSTDWQVLKIYTDNLFVEIDCNSGEKRTIKKTRCKCGEAVLVQQGGWGGRADGKRVFYPDDDPNTLWGAFRCRKCHEPVAKSVPGAEYEEC
jgi:hypothetical protein